MAGLRQLYEPIHNSEKIRLVVVAVVVAVVIIITEFIMLLFSIRNNYEMLGGSWIIWIISK